ncbi:sulfurtransferase TusA family protein [Vulcanisaeta thermophila]|uniref:sulfurtransferase TusA family protein n=1 Tax=Vulcanisaeta thermophila TaxID=867917 RepID=UPI000853B377|nr:sulfurtransferase TusA family protein [Vulcanisaeta thermophila]
MAEEIILDVRGKMCPIPVMEVSKVSRQVKPGQVIKVLATDPAAKPDLQSWAKRTGNEILEIKDEAGYTVIRIRINNPVK